MEITRILDRTNQADFCNYAPASEPERISRKVFKQAQKFNISDKEMVVVRSQRKETS